MVDSPEIAPATLATELRAFVGKMKRRLREQADVGDFTPSQVSALLRLEQEGPMTTSALARAEGVRSQSMGATLAPLQAASYVAGTPDPADGRQTLLDLTPACREWIAVGRAARQDWLARLIARELSPQEQAVLAEAVVLLKRVADA